MDVLLEDIPALSRKPEERASLVGLDDRTVDPRETEALLSGRYPADEEANVRIKHAQAASNKPSSHHEADDDLTSPFLGLNTLEIAAVADAKKFLSQKPVQRIITDIWNGSIVFWDTLNVDTKKKAKRYDKRTANPYSRLRVPVAFPAVQAELSILTRE